jgi:hypothetical protein
LNLILGLSFNVFLYVLIILQVIYAYKFFDFKQFSIPRIQNVNSLNLLIIVSIAVIYYQKQIIPWGAWDGTFIWNLHAKFLFEQELWPKLFSKQISWSHPDYPLFLPSLIAMFWHSSGSVSTIVPILICLLPTLGIIVLLYSSLKNALIGFIPCAIILSDKFFMGQASSQYADTWLAFFILLGTYLITHIKQNKSIIFVAGIILSGTFWVKNEGFFFFLISSLLVVFQFRGDPKSIFKYFLGTLSMTIIFLVFKFYNSIENEIFNGFLKTFTSKLFDVKRYVLILQFFKISILENFPVLPFLAIFLAINFNKFKRVSIYPFVGIFFLSATYFFIYVFTPIDLAWHLEFSLDRLIHHVYPSILLLFFWGIEGYSSKTI